MNHKNEKRFVRVVVTPNSTTSGTVNVQYLDELPKAKSVWRRVLETLLPFTEASDGK